MQSTNTQPATNPQLSEQTLTAVVGGSANLESTEAGNKGFFKFKKKKFFHHYHH